MRRLLLLGTVLFSSNFTFADHIEVRLPGEESVVIEIDSTDTVKGLKVQLEEVFGLPQESQMLIQKYTLLPDEIKLSALPSKVIWVETISSKKTHAGYRDYYAPLSKSEKSDIHFILKTMAQKSLVQLMKLKSKLQSAGDRIDQIHPLAFLSHIFRDEELKAYVHAVKKRGGFLWDEFFSGLKETLKEETEIGNMHDDLIYHFASQVGVDVGIISGPIQSREWDHLIKLLIIHIPREEDSGRYDM